MTTLYFMYEMERRKELMCAVIEYHSKSITTGPNQGHFFR